MEQHNPYPSYPNTGVAGVAGNAKPAVPVEQAIHRIQAELENLQHELEGLYARLTSYLSEISPAVNNQAPLAPMSGSSPTTQRLAELSTRLALTTQELVNFKLRLEA